MANTSNKDQTLYKAYFCKELGMNGKTYDTIHLTRVVWMLGCNNDKIGIRGVVGRWSAETSTQHLGLSASQHWDCYRSVSAYDWHMPSKVLGAARHLYFEWAATQIHGGNAACVIIEELRFVSPTTEKFQPDHSRPDAANGRRPTHSSAMGILFSAKPTKWSSRNSQMSSTQLANSKKIWIILVLFVFKTF